MGTVVLMRCGQDPTAGSVINDIVDVVKANKGISGGCKLTHVSPDECKPAGQLKLKDRFISDSRLKTAGQLIKVADYRQLSMR